MKMIDLGQKLGEPSAVSDNEANEVYYPSIYLNGDAVKDLDLKSMQPGVEMQMVAKVRVRSVTMSDKERGSVEIEVVEAGFEAAPKSKDRAQVLYGDDD